MNTRHVEHDDRLEGIIELVMRIAEGDFGARGAISDHRDMIDAVMSGLNMLAGDFEAEHERRKRAEGLLEDAIEAYEDAPGLFCSVDASSLEVVKCNRTLLNAVGLSAEETLGASVLDLYHPSCREDAGRALRHISEETPLPRTRFLLDVRGGPPLTVDFSGSPVRDASGGVVRLRLLWRDVTLEQLLQRQLQQAQKMDAVGRLAGGIAHDFNNILMVISGFTEMLQRRFDDGSPERRQVDPIAHAVEQASGLTNHLLSFSRKRDVKAEPSDLNAIVDRSKSMLRRLLTDEIRLETRLAADLPAVMLDPTLFEQVVLNLAINSRDAMPKGGTISLSTGLAGAAELARLEHLSEVEEYACITVTDTGSGMSPEVLARALEPFFTTKSVGKGTGLGLSTCYGVVGQLGGHLEIDSVQGEGTSVHVFVPTARGARASAPPESIPEARGGQETILLVEDDAAVRDLTASVLERAGYHVLTAENGVAALAIDSEYGDSIDALVLDMMMPEMGGAETARHMQSLRPEARYVFMSGYWGETPKTLDQLPEGHIRLDKPFRADALLRALRTVLDARVDLSK